MVLTLSPSWPLVGIILILIGFLVKFEIQVVDQDDQQEISPSKKIKPPNEFKG